MLATWLALHAQVLRQSSMQSGYCRCRPEYQSIMRNNIILAGGGSLIDGLADAVAEGLADIGDVSVWCATKDPVTKVAEGALALAGDMPDDQFTAITEFELR